MVNIRDLVKRMMNDCRIVLKCPLCFLYVAINVIFGNVSLCFVLRFY